MQQTKKGPGAPAANNQNPAGQKLKRPKAPEIDGAINAIEETETNDMAEVIDDLFGGCGC